MTTIIRRARPAFRLADALAIAGPLLVGGIGGAVTASAIPTWYAALQKPAWNPPNAVFGPVWTLLYLGMGVAAAIVWRTPPGARRTGALALFLLQLVLNLAWTLTFFGFRETGLAVAVVAALWLAIAATLVSFAGVSRLAAALLAPYLAWVTFASVLNAAVWRLNGG